MWSGRTRSRSATRAAGSVSNRLNLPDGWEYSTSLSCRFGFVSNGEESARAEFLEHRDGMDVYRDRETGKETYVARSSPGT